MSVIYFKKYLFWKTDALYRKLHKMHGMTLECLCYACLCLEIYEQRPTIICIVDLGIVAPFK